MVPCGLAIGILVYKNAEMRKRCSIIACAIGSATKELALNSIFCYDIIENGANIDAGMFTGDVTECKQSFTKTKLIIHPVGFDSYPC
jgi:hypothetical protein